MAQTAFFVPLALGWIFAALYVRRGMRRIPHVRNVSPVSARKHPKISILFAARDEAKNLPAALSSLAALDYPQLQIIAIDDRSADGTGKILDDFAALHPNAKAIHVTDLPSGWLGKPHALQKGVEHASGEWLIFTDGDVQMGSDLVARALALAEMKQWHYLTLTARLDIRGLWEAAAIGYLGMLLTFLVRPWLVSDPKSASYMGVGAFQLIRRTTYDAVGGHARLAMEVIDDMKLAKIVKVAGFPLGLAAGDHLVRVRWHDGIGNVIRGVTKNFFAGFSFQVWQALVAIVGILVISIAPAAGVIACHGAARVVAAAAVATAMVLTGRLLREAGASQLYGLAHPIGAVIVIVMILTSMLMTLWRGGIIWRGTFYRLDELKRGLM